MSKMLSIIIPYFNEKQAELFPLLSSINNQIGTDPRQIEVILVNDGNDNCLPQQFLGMFPSLDIKVLYMKENGGPGVARQYGMDRAEGEYLMFCDADDVLHSVGIIGAFLNEIAQNQPDIITTPWLEELKDETTGQMIYITHENETTWLHGKVFKDAFIKSFNIHFHDELRVHEDSYFLSIAFELTENKRKIPVISYVWKWRKESITRQDNGAYTYNSVPIFNQAVAASLHEIARRGLKDRLPYKVVQMAAYTYFCMHQDCWLQEEVTEYRETAEVSFTESFKPFIEYFRDADECFIREVYNQERLKSFLDGIETETFDVWLDRIGFR